MDQKVATAAGTKAVEASTEEKDEVKAAVTRKGAAEKKTAGRKKVETVETVYVQFADAEVEVAALVDAAKAAFKAEKSRTTIHDLKLYVKPAESAAYYVVNGEFTGKVNF